jgi:hypothetical protein
MTDNPRQCQTCRHWSAAPNASRGACALGEIDFPWCYNGCARHLAVGEAQPAPAPVFDMRTAWGQYIPNLGKTP